MKIFLLMLFGFFGGVLGGMGMGGGTLLIPLLAVGLNMLQIKAQAINLIAFLPMSAVALIIHSKNNLVRFGIAIPIAISGTVSAIVSAVIASATKSQILSIWFGIFLIVVGVFQLYTILLFQDKKSKGIITPKNKW